MKEMENRGHIPLLPPVSHSYIVKWWLEIGATASGAMGESSLSWQEIDAWVRRTETDLEPWEARAIKRMSVEFVNERHAAKKPLCPAPYALGEPDEYISDRVTQQFKAMMASFGRA